MPISDPKHFFTALFEAAVAAADPETVIRDFVPAKPKGRTIVVGAGKGSAQMARAFEKAWNGSLSGVVVTRYGYAAQCEQVEILEAAHPVPDAAGLAASRRLIEAVGGLTGDDLVVALISGGGSALLPMPPDGMTLAEEIAVNEALLASGAPISAMNTVRKHLSAIKGGRLAAAAHPAKVITLVVSDIPGDNPAFVASGPTVPDRATRADALAVVETYGLKMPDAAMFHLRSDAANAPRPDDPRFALHRIRQDGGLHAAMFHLRSDAANAPRPDDPRFAGNEVHVIASAAKSLEAAAAEAERGGVKAAILSDSMEGEARDVGAVHAAMAREIAARDRPFQKPVLLLSGGETTVTIRDKGGRGGRNSEFLLALALGIDGVDAISAFAADTDGIDGSENNAGAFADWRTAQRLREAGLDPRALLTRHDSWGAFDALGDLFAPGPTGTNVNDLRAVLVR
jgi:hydroxypyruvate reductase